MFSANGSSRASGRVMGGLRRWALGAAYALRPRRISVLPAVAASVVRTFVGLERRDACLVIDDPQPRHPLGFVGICGDLDPDSLMQGFRRGLYPFSHVGRKKWWMLPDRMTLAPHEIVRDKDVRRMLRNKKFRVTFDNAFEEIMRACAQPRSGKVPLTWITEDIISAYVGLHKAGRAHSFEVWGEDGALAGGGFGIAVGPIFVIESQFTRQRNASKVGMITLLRHLSEWGFALADGKAHTTYLDSMGFKALPHEDYMAVLRAGPADLHVVGPWRVDETLDGSGDWGPAGKSRLADITSKDTEAVGSENGPTIGVKLTA
jgi:leucyl/phenylalanyl-tRNA--protein transferase